MDSSRRKRQNGQVIVLVRVSGTNSRVIAVELQVAPDRPGAASAVDCGRDVAKRVMLYASPDRGGFG